MSSNFEQNIMLDIETLGTGYRAPIIQISAIPFSFDDKPLLGAFDMFATIGSNVKAGLIPDKDTLLWWLSQGRGAMEVIHASNEKGADIKSVLSAFSQYLEGFLPDGPIAIWANSPTFDCRLIKEACELLKVPIVWNFRDERDLRTLVATAESVANFDKRSVKSNGTKHNALHDCLYQIDVARAAYNSLKGK